jgi:glutamine amidotransferase
MSKIIIIDYNLGNLFSVQHACTSLGLDVKVSQDPIEIKNAEAIILPGVGAFNEAMINLEKLNLIEPIKDHINNNKPFFGICLGLQLLFTESEEFGNRKGLNIIEGKVVRFPKEIEGNKLIVPQIGWNTISPKDSKGFKDSPLEGIKDNEFVYFVHSYFVAPENEEDILTYTNYEGHRYCSSVRKNNIFATQFHPEKSGKEGLKIYKNWAKQNNLI